MKIFIMHLFFCRTAGLASTVLTSPLDVLRTRFQSSISRRHCPPQPVQASLLGLWSRHVLQTASVMRNIHHVEGWRGLFRGLAPSLSGVVPSMALKFYVYGNCKRLGARMLDCVEDAALVHAQAAVAASLVVSTVMNPVFVVKTRLQLDGRTEGAKVTARRYTGSLNCVRKILQQEGVRGLYQGLGASYLGAVETVFQLVLYEQLKKVFSPISTGANAQGDVTWGHAFKSWAGTSGAAGTAKLAAILVTYPHEVRQVFSPSTHVILSHIIAGAADKATTGPDRKWGPQVRWTCAVFSIDQGRRGLSGLLWWHDAALDAFRSVSYHHIWSVRVCVKAARLGRKELK